MAYQMGIHRGESQDLSRWLTLVNQTEEKMLSSAKRSPADSCQRRSGRGTLVTSDVWTLFYELDDKGGILATNSFYIKSLFNLTLFH